MLTVPDLPVFDPERVVTTLARHGVHYVLVGAVAARLQGFPRMTADTDITPEQTAGNLGRLATALRELGARVYTEGVPTGLAFDISAQALGRAANWNLVTSAGRLEIVFEPSGTGGFADLDRNALAFTIRGAPLRVASLTDILRTKEAANRPQDRQDAAVIREMLRRQKH
jgi:hypothetical protein